MSLSEIILILLVAFLVIKPEQLPEVALTLGRCMRWVRQTLGKAKKEVNSFIHSIEHIDEQSKK